ncbi:MAG: hypothetical protein ACJ8DI_06005 [Ktedonobacteraceae bacterium]
MVARLVDDVVVNGTRTAGYLSPRRFPTNGRPQGPDPFPTPLPPLRETRHFYRQRYNATKTPATFLAALRKHKG